MTVVYFMIVSKLGVNLGVGKSISNGNKSSGSTDRSESRERIVCRLNYFHRISSFFRITIIPIKVGIIFPIFLKSKCVNFLTILRMP